MLVLCIGDLHYGERGDSEKYCKQVNDMLLWAVDEAKTRNCDTVVQFGDWFHNRTRVNVQTMKYGVEGAQILGESFINAYTLVSNHDIYHRDRLDVNSMEILRPYITVIDKPTRLLDTSVVMWPWVTSPDVWDQYINESRDFDFMFGHLELNSFKMNDNYEMEHGFSPKEIRFFKKVLTGHYHSPQTKDNVTYLGVPVPHSMSEANRELGIYFFDTDTGELEFVQYGGVKVVSIPYDQLDKLEDFDPENTYVRVEFPDDLDDETKITEAREFLESKNFAESKIQYTDTKAKQILSADVGEVSEVENIDEVVMSFLKNGKPVEGIDNDMLESLYKQAKEIGDA